MVKNDFKAFATGDDANVLSQQDYEALVARSSGFQSGIAQSAQMNKVLRQSSIMAAVLAQFIVDQAGKDAIDNGSVDTLVENLKAAIFNDTALTGVPTAPTPGAGDDSTRLATTAFVQQLSGNFATQHWVRDNSVNKAGDTMTGTLNTPNLSVNQGVENDTSAALIYNDQGRRNIVFRTGPAGEYKYSFIDEEGVLTLPVRPVWKETPWDTGNFDPEKKAEIDSPTFTGLPKVPTPPLFESSTNIASTAFVRHALGSFNGGNRPGSGISEEVTLLTNDDIGGFCYFNGRSNQTATLPNEANLPVGATITFQRGSVSDLIISTYKADQIIDTTVGLAVSITLVAGEFVKLVWSGKYWQAFGTYTQRIGEQFAHYHSQAGFQKLPGGLIFQWGIATFNERDGFSGTLVNFPIAFPHGALQIVGSDSDAAVGTFSFRPISPTQFKVWSIGGVGNGPEYRSYGARYFAVGN
ncbi:gp53-like domain-containing protein [Burkholderia plantarii]|uniref:gp53-like domain-containing protein n=1 Tax=Burkholderia plantarii TaxID=41899 RepID=UPI0007068C4F|nr:hypothetical protein [Burkholderia plantarii]ALK30469.1 bacteriophage tail protein [Burkholderia plantarii]GLZ19857.1 hypothetical protein Bpla01_33860 [Burkholderia plantarii]